MYQPTRGGGRDHTEDPTSTTIEFLRARLLAERAVSKSARAKLDGLADKVAELEEQLQIVSLQRKKAEQATGDILAILVENGFTDVSDAYDSNSDHESCSQTNSGSGKSISWKGRVRDPDSSDKIKESRNRRHRGFKPVYFSSPRLRQGRSCRQIRHSESRTGSKDYRSYENPICPPENGACTEIIPQTSEEASKTVVDVKGDESLKMLSNSNGLKKENSMDINLERALENRAHVIGSFENMEETQKEWEKNFRENKSSALDLCDVGDHSDVTNESSGEKAQAQAQLGGSRVVSSLRDTRTIANEVDIMESFETVLQLGSPDKCCKSCGSKSMEEVASSFGDSGERISEGISEHSSSTTRSLSITRPNSRGGSISNAITIQKADYPLVPVAKEKSETCDTVLTALKQAKLSLQEKVNSLHIRKPEYLSDRSGPSSPGSYMNKTALPMEPTLASSIGPNVEFPVSCAGLFRVPTDFSPDASRKNNFLPPSFQKALVSHIPEEGFQNELVDASPPLLTDDRLPTTPYIVTPKLWAGFREDGQPMVSTQESRVYKDTPSVSDIAIFGETSHLDGKPFTRSLYPDSVMRSREMYSTPYYTRPVGLPPTGGSDDGLSRRV